MPSLTLQDGSKLAYSEVGTGPTLVLVHGSPGQGRSWARVAPLLSDHYRMLMPDLPGYGGSDRGPDAPAERTAALGAAVGALISSIDAPVRVCGHSYGGNVALHAALAHADRVSSLTLLEPVFFRALQVIGDSQELPPAAAFFSAYADRVTGGEPTAVHQMIDFWFGSGAFSRMPAPVQGFLTAEAPKNGVDVRAAFAERIAREELSDFRKPVCVAYGDTSPPVMLAITKALAGLLPNSRLESIPGANHGMLDGHPAAVAELIRRC